MIRLFDMNPEISGSEMTVQQFLSKVKSLEKSVEKIK